MFMNYYPVDIWGEKYIGLYDRLIQQDSGSRVCGMCDVSLLLSLYLHTSDLSLFWEGKDEDVHILEATDSYKLCHETNQLPAA